MVANALEANFIELIKLFEMRKVTGRRTVLFLGARAGGLFRSKSLYQDIQGFGIDISNFNKLSRTGQFGECYPLLERLRYSESDMDGFLTKYLQNLDISEADTCLAELVKQGLFDIIISTNIDDVLERAFAQVEMKEIHDFQVFIPKNDTTEKIVRPEIKLICTIVKAFGDLASRDYKTVRREFNLDDDKNLKGFLESTLERDILVIGYDPVWDRGIERAFPARGDSLWFVDEEEPPKDSLLSHSLRDRRGKCIVGSYESFIQALHWHIMGARPLNYQLTRDIFGQLGEISSQLQAIRKELATLREETSRLSKSIEGK